MQGQRGMATRQIRPRPVDQNKPLEIIRDFTELDGTIDATTGQQLATTLESILAAAEVPFQSPRCAVLCGTDRALLALPCCLV